MKKKVTTAATLALSFLLLNALSGAAQEDAEECFVDEEWITGKVAPDNRQPESPLADCSAYRWAWQTFLFVTSLDSTAGQVDFLSYPSFDEVFGVSERSNFARLSVPPDDLPRPLSLAPRTPEPENPSVSDGIKQAGLEGILVDQNGHAVFYAIHMNDVFVDFVVRKNLNDLISLEALDPDIEFPVGSLELKSSWSIVDSSNPPTDYITTRALIPSIKKAADGSVFADANDPVEATVALLGLHVVGVIENHPEFIWASFEHDGLAPQGQIPADPMADYIVSRDDFTLYAGGTTSLAANEVATVALDESTGKLSPATSVFRYYATAHLTNPKTDEGVDSINESARRTLSDKAADDPRSHYKLIGAVWLRDGARDFIVNKTFVDPPGTPVEKATVAGENALSNMSMESFTQVGSPSCFNCHKTRESVEGLAAKKINVSHIPLMFYAREKAKLQ
jgi:hypothetical protein